MHYPSHYCQKITEKVLNRNMNVIFAWIIENSGNTILITYIKECNYEKSIIFRHSVHTFWDRDKSSVLLQEGIYQEETLGNFEKAIDIYQQIIEADKSNRQSVAQALYRQGMCYLKKQDTSNARVSLKKLISKYPEQTDLIDKAMPVLRGLYDYDPATLMPADTLLYIEIGNPGQQIETILNMLKGTPFADPTALMRGPGMPQQDMPQGGMMGPAAFMNEGMMNEFKKVRGFAVGITEFSQNNPPLVMVLYPGESDALKGMITGS
jgi:tetratricopeptide (TPR) repeat protein